MIEWNSFTVWTAFVSFETKHRQTENNRLHFGFLAGSGSLCMPSQGLCMIKATSDVQRFDVKDKHVSAFQLESLILAQNERWRQA